MPQHHADEFGNEKAAAPATAVAVAANATAAAATTVATKMITESSGLYLCQFCSGRAARP